MIPSHWTLFAYFAVGSVIVLALEGEWAWALAVAAVVLARVIWRACRAVAATRATMRGLAVYDGLAREENPGSGEARLKTEQNSRYRLLTSALPLS